MSTRTGVDRVRWGSLGILGSLAWKPFGVAKNAGPQADKPRKKWRVPRGVYDSYGHIGQPAKQRRGGRRQRRRECNEELAETQHVAKTDGGGWVAVAGEVPDSSSRNAGGADAPRVHAANNVGADYLHPPQPARDPSPPGRASEHYQRQHRHFFMQDSGWIYDENGLQHPQTGQTQTAHTQTAQVQTARAPKAKAQAARGQTARGQTARGQTARGQTARGQTARVRPHAPFPDQRSHAQAHHIQQQQHHHHPQQLHPTQQPHHTQHHPTQQLHYGEAQYQYTLRQPHTQHAGPTERSHPTRQLHHAQHHPPQQLHYGEAQYHYIPRQPHVQHVGPAKRIHTTPYEFPHQGGQCYEYGHGYQGRCS